MPLPGNAEINRRIGGEIPNRTVKNALDINLPDPSTKAAEARFVVLTFMKVRVRRYPAR